jgi:hypothetical protein
MARIGRGDDAVLHLDLIAVMHRDLCSRGDITAERFIWASPR